VRLQGEAFAKINRRLRVLRRRPDGYHEIDTVFQTVDLSDRITVEAGGSGIEIRCTDPAVPTDERNLVWRAGRQLAERLNRPARARIYIEKRIPTGGGLGGGSSDAAVALVLLARLWGSSADRAQLERIGSGIGSDVPFFFHGGTARGRGRGEILEEEPDGPAPDLLLVVPPFPVSTADVYAAWRPGPAPDAATRRERSPGAYFGINDLEPAVLETHPDMGRYLAGVAEEAPDCLISGSGSTIAARPTDGPDEAAARLRERLPEARVYTVHPLPRWDYHVRASMDHAKEVTQA
jgi:4-diphosphocytidyl-2-C-methyl-D-erythritol kinase